MVEQAKAVGLEVVPKQDLHRTGRKVPIQLKNVTDKPIKLGALMLVEQVSAATPVIPEEVKDLKNVRQLQAEFQQCAEVLSPAWQNRMKTQLMRWEKLFSKDNFDVRCGKSAKHRICLQEDKPFRERPRRIPLSDLKDLREQLAKLKKSGVIQESESLYISHCGSKEKEWVVVHVYRLSDSESTHHPRPVHHTPY